VLILFSRQRGVARRDATIRAAELLSPSPVTIRDTGPSQRWDRCAYSVTSSCRIFAEHKTITRGESRDLMTRDPQRPEPPQPPPDGPATPGTPATTEPDGTPVENPSGAL